MLFETGHQQIITIGIVGNLRPKKILKTWLRTFKSDTMQPCRAQETDKV